VSRRSLERLDAGNGRERLQGLVRVKVSGRGARERPRFRLAQLDAPVVGAGRQQEQERCLRTRGRGDRGEVRADRGAAERDPVLRDAARLQPIGGRLEIPGGARPFAGGVEGCVIARALRTGLAVGMSAQIEGERADALRREPLREAAPFALRRADAVGEGRYSAEIVQPSFVGNETFCSASFAAGGTETGAAAAARARFKARMIIIGSAW
jgi:hypothetical protein